MHHVKLKLESNEYRIYVVKFETRTLRSQRQMKKKNILKMHITRLAMYA
jgi:hypothetical protein